MSVELRILDFNYAHKDNVALSGSSENPNFPASNGGDPFRSTLWKSAGYFVIDATNNKIDFKESSGGGELTATITVGNYSVSGLEAEIKAQLEAVGAETYTVSYSTVIGRWTISHVGAFLSLLWLSGTNTAESIGPSIGYAVTDQTGAITYTGASVAIHTEEYLQIDLKTAENIDTFGLFFDPERGIRFSDQATLNLQANATANWSSPAVDISLTLDNSFRVSSHFFTTNQHYRYWRIKIVDPKNNDLSVELGAICLGKATVLSRNPSNGFKFTIEDRSKNQRTDFGHLYSDSFPKVRGLDFNFNLLTTADAQTLRDIFEDLGTSTYFMLALDSQAAVFNKNWFLIYGTITKNQAFNNVVRGIFNAPVSVKEAF